MPELPSRLTFVNPNVVASIRGDAQRVARNTWLQESRQIPGADTAWMGPRQPIQPFAYPGTPLRAWSYPVGVNIQYTPRGEADTDRFLTFQQLQFFAQSCDIVRILIESRKNLLRQVQYSFKLRYVDPNEAEQLTLQDKRIQFLTRFFDYPDPIRKVHFDPWLTQLLDDMLVLDAPCMEIQRDKAGKPLALVPISGSTIKPLIGVDGLRPSPPAPAYQQVINGVPMANLDTTQMLYFPRNPRLGSLYGYSPVEQIVFSLNLLLRRMVSQLQYYTESNEPKGFLSLPPEWSNEQQLRQFQGMLNALLSGNMPERMKVLVVPHGSQYSDVKQQGLTDQFDQWVAQIACFAFGVSPMPFLFMRTNRATAESARNQALQEGLGPFIRWVETLLTYIVHQVWGWQDIEATSKDDTMMDPEQKMRVHTAYFDRGIYSANKILSDLGLGNVPGGDTHARMTQGGLVTLDGKPLYTPPAAPPPEELNTDTQQELPTDDSETKLLKALLRKKKVQRKLGTLSPKLDSAVL